MFRYCFNLKYLQICGTAKMFDLQYCPLLRTLNLSCGWCHENDEVLRRSTQLTRLVLGNHDSNTDPQIRARVAVTREGPLRLADWVAPK